MKDYLAREMKGHNILALERFQDNTHWMVEYKDLATLDEFRFFLDDEGYRQLMQRAKNKEIHIQTCAHVTEGHIVEFLPAKVPGKKPRRHMKTVSTARGMGRDEKHIQCH